MFKLPEILIKMIQTKITNKPIYAVAGNYSKECRGCDGGCHGDCQDTCWRTCIADYGTWRS